MNHSIEAATTGRSKCRACGSAIPKGELRFGERLPNPFGDEGSETVHWYHVLCGAYRRPESFSAVLDGDASGLDMHHRLVQVVEAGLAHHRLERINALERSPSGRARCRQCREAIGKDTFRVGLVFFEEGMANPAGFVHLACAPAYFETASLQGRLEHFASGLDEDDLSAAAAELEAAPGPGEAERGGTV